MINGARRPFSSDCCIYRVPRRLREENEKAYTPRSVSIGPLHRNNKTLKAMQGVKIEYFKQFLERATKTTTENIDGPEEENYFLCLDKFIEVLKSSEEKIRKSYADNLNHISSDELLKIILVDSAFIIELFLRFHEHEQGSEVSEDRKLPTPFLLVSIRMDLWLLENQVPFFVLEKLYNEAFALQNPNIRDLSLRFFKNYNKQKVRIGGEIKHFTDLLRTFLLPIPKDDENSSNVRAHEENCSKMILKIFTDFLRCRGLLSSSARRDVDQKGPSYFERVSYSEQLKSATQLHAAGVVLDARKSQCLLDISFSKPKRSSSNCLLDINFSKPKLEIPCLHLYDDTEALFRNVMALEQYNYPEESLVCDYVTMMDYLINTSEDAELLVEKKIIKNRLGSNQEVASLFNSLCRNILKDIINKRFNCLIKDLNAYYYITCHHWKATCCRLYFSTPWKTASTIAAFILLLLTLIQTILTAVAL